MKLIKKALIATSLLLSTLVVAAPAYHIERIYFSDASHTNAVGEYTLTCYGTSFLEGSRTRHYVNLIKQSCSTGGL